MSVDNASTIDGEEPNQPSALQKALRSRLMRCFMAIGVLAATIACHQFILSACVRPLEISIDDANFDHVLVIDGDRCFHRAAQMGQNRRLQYIVSKWQSSRLVRRGLHPSRSQIAVQQLVKHGVNRSSITVLSATAHNTAHLARIIGQQLSANRDLRIGILCDAFHGRSLRTVVDSNLPPGHAKRIAIIGLKNRQYDRNNWWQSKAGLLAVFHNYIDLYFAVAPPKSTQWKECDPTDISRSVGQ
jgi:hypothetical protein